MTPYDKGWGFGSFRRTIWMSTFGLFSSAHSQYIQLLSKPHITEHRHIEITLDTIGVDEENSLSNFIVQENVHFEISVSSILYN